MSQKAGFSTISQLIKHLTMLQGEYGDLKVVFDISSLRRDPATIYDALYFCAYHSASSNSHVLNLVIREQSHDAN